MLDKLYDDVLSVMTEKGFISWFEKNQTTVSPLKWCYDKEGRLKSPPIPPKDITWLGNSYDPVQYHPHTIKINNRDNV